MGSTLSSLFPLFPLLSLFSSPSSLSLSSSFCSLLSPSSCSLFCLLHLYSLSLPSLVFLRSLVSTRAAAHAHRPAPRTHPPPRLCAQKGMSASLPAIPPRVLSSRAWLRSEVRGPGGSAPCTLHPTTRTPQPAPHTPHLSQTPSGADTRGSRLRAGQYFTYGENDARRRNIVGRPGVTRHLRGAVSDTHIAYLRRRIRY